eukprot:m.341864 g.341864  ORF g.341864 m.341864 type:complete len:2216 (+) comp16115_c0_seq11:108-6755(+)
MTPLARTSVAALLVCFVAVAVHAAPDTNTWYEGYNGHQYRFQNNLLPTQGVGACSNIGGTFAILNSDGDRGVVQYLLQGQSAAVNLVWRNFRYERYEGTVLSSSDYRPNNPSRWWNSYCWRLDSNGNFATTGCSSSQWIVCERPGASYRSLSRGVFDYTIHYGQSVSFANARIFCEGLGPNVSISTVDSQAESEFIRQYITTNTWIGLNDNNGDGVYEWADGAPFSTTTRNAAGFGPDLNLMGGSDSMDIDQCIYLTTAGGDWQDRSCDNDHNIVCRKQVEECTPSNYRNYADNECTACPLGTFTDSPNQVECKPFTVCALTEAEFAPPTPSSDRVCGLCPPGTFMEENSQGVRVCSNCTLGVNFQAGQGQTQCDPLRTCIQGTYISRNGTLDTDRDCSACDGTSVYQDEINQFQCKPVTPCSAFSQTLTRSTPSNNFECLDCVLNQTFFKNGFCFDVSNCTIGTAQSAPPTITSDRVCKSDTYDCVDGVSSDGGLACTCPSDEVCASCRRQDSFESKYGVVLLLSNSHPNYAVDLFESCIQVNGTDLVEACAAECTNSSGCNSFSLSGSGECCLKSEYSLATTYYKVGQFYSLSRCSVCDAGYIARGTGCTLLSTPPEFPTTPILVTIPLSTPIGTDIATIQASSTVGSVTYSLPTPSNLFTVNETTGVLSLTNALTVPKKFEIVVAARDSRSECNLLVEGRLKTVVGGCNATTSATVQVAVLLGCPSDRFLYLPPDQDTRQLTLPAAPYLPSFLTSFQLESSPSGLFGTDVQLEVAEGVTTVEYSTTTALTIGGSLSCAYNITAERGFLVVVDEIGRKSSSLVIQEFLVASPELSPAATDLPSFASDLSSAFAIGLVTANDKPFTVGVPADTVASMHIQLRWCDDDRGFVSDLSAAVNASTEVVFTGLQDGGQNVAFVDSGTFFVDGDLVCLQMAASTAEFTSSIVFSSLSIRFTPPQNRRRGLATVATLLPVFPSYISIRYTSTNSSEPLDPDGSGVTLNDLQPPQFLDCPTTPLLETTTSSATTIEATLPSLNVIDTNDPEPVLTYPSATLNVLDSPHSLTVTATDSSGNTAYCTFTVEIEASTSVLELSTLVTQSTFDSDITQLDFFEIRNYLQYFPLDSADISSFEADLGAYQEVSATFTSPEGTPFFVKTRSAAEFGRFSVDLSWVKPAVLSNPPPLVVQSEVSATLELIGLELETSSDQYQQLSETQRANSVKPFMALDATVTVDPVKGIFGLRGVSAEFDGGFAFTEARLTVKYRGVSTDEVATWTLTDDSSFAVEYEYAQDPAVATTTAVDDARLGFFLLYDTVAPQFDVCPSQYTSAAPIVVSTQPGSNFGLVTWVVSASDNQVDPVVTSNYDVDYRFVVKAPDAEPYRVVVTAADAFENTAECEFYVRVEDTEKPSLKCPKRNLAATLSDSSSTVTISDADWQARSTSDNSDGAGLDPVVLVSNTAQAEYTVGTTKVRAFYEDAWGLSSSCLVNVIVTDETPPVVECPVLNSIPTELDAPTAVVQWTSPRVSDNSGVVQYNMTAQSGDSFAIGTHSVFVNATDGVGLSSNCTFSFEVVGQKTPPPEESSSSAGMYGGIGAAAGLLVLAVIVIVVVVRRANARFKQPQNWEEIFALMDQFNEGDEDGPRHPREIPRSAIKLLDELGKGQFGIVYKGMLKEIPNRPGFLTAVKSLNSRSNADRMELLEEAAVMAQLVHPHIVELIGVVTIGNPALVVLEFMEYGALKSYLEKNDITRAQMLMFAGDCAAGLEHIHAKGFIHRDVAARNVLLSSEMRCKISDFGLAREMEEDDTYYRSRGGQLPVRWTAPEALDSHKFSEKTDVWSFGVLCNEIWTKAVLPYKGWSNQKVWVAVSAGSRLERPSNMVVPVYDVLLQCWHEDSHERPTFVFLHQFFRSQHKEMTGEDCEIAVIDPSAVSEEQPRRRSSVLGRLFKGMSSKRSSVSDPTAMIPLSINTTAVNPVYQGATVEEEFDDAFVDGYDEVLAEEEVESVAPPSTPAWQPRDDEEAGSDDDDGPLYDAGDEVRGGASCDIESDGEGEPLYDAGDGFDGEIQVRPARSTLRIPLGQARPVFTEDGSPSDTVAMPGSTSSATASADNAGDDDDAMLYDNTAPSSKGALVDFGFDEAVSAEHVGERVQVQGYACLGTLKFFGEHVTKGGLRCGVDLDEPIGLNDGTVGGHRYFACEPNHGVLTAPHKVTLVSFEMSA